MSVLTYEGIVENGQIRLGDNVKIPENSTVYVLVPDAKAVSVARIVSPRLVDPRDAARFKLEIVEEPTDVGVFCDVEMR